MSPNPFEPTPKAIHAAAVALWDQQMHDLGATKVFPFGHLGEAPKYVRMAKVALAAAARANGIPL